MTGRHPSSTQKFIRPFYTPSWKLVPAPLPLLINRFSFFISFLSFVMVNIFAAGADEVADGGAGRVVSIYQSTCHKALSHCQSDLQCRKHLDPFLRYCNGGGSTGLAGGADTCHRDLCMQALQGFYKDAPLQWSLEVAFCVCKWVAFCFYHFIIACTLQC